MCGFCPPCLEASQASPSKLLTVTIFVMNGQNIVSVLSLLK